MGNDGFCLLHFSSSCIFLNAILIYSIARSATSATHDHNIYDDQLWSPGGKIATTRFLTVCVLFSHLLFCSRRPERKKKVHFTWCCALFCVRMYNAVHNCCCLFQSSCDAYRCFTADFCQLMTHRRENCIFLGCDWNIGGHHTCFCLWFFHCYAILHFCCDQRCTDQIIVSNGGKDNRRSWIILWYLHPVSTIQPNQNEKMSCIGLCDFVYYSTYDARAWYWRLDRGSMSLWSGCRSVEEGRLWIEFRI